MKNMLNSTDDLELDVETELDIETDIDIDVDTNMDMDIDIDVEPSSNLENVEELNIDVEPSNTNQDLDIEVEPIETDTSLDITKVVSNLSVGVFDEESEELEIETYVDDIFSESNMMEDYDELEIEAQPLLDSQEVVKESEEERQERLLNTKIRKWQKLRENVDIEENKEQLEEMLDEASIELKNYINNIHSTLSLDYEAEVTSVDTDNVSREYFELLRHWFKAKYLEHITSNLTYTPEQFLEDDIKTDLLNLGSRIDLHLRNYVNSQPRFTPMNLLSNEYAIQQLVKTLNDEIDKTNLVSVNSDRRKSERSSLVISLTQQYLPNNFNEDAEYTLVNQVILEDKESFVCGKCGEESVATDPFFLLGVIPLRAEVGNKIRQHKVARIPGANKCPHCGAINTLTVDEVNELATKLEKLNANNIDKFVDASKAFCSGFKFTRYRGNSNFLYNTLPHIYAKVDYTSEEVVEQDYDADLGEAYLRYIKLLKFFRNGLKLNKNLNTFVPYEELTSKTAEKAPQANILNPTVFKEYVFNSSGEYNLKQLVKILCSCVGKCYATIKHNAENSLLNAIINSPYYDKICYTKSISSELASESKDIVKYMDDLDEENLVQIMTDFAIRYGIDTSKYIKDDKVIRSELDNFKQLMSSTFENCRLQSEQLKKERESVISQLLDNIRLLSFTPIVSLSFINESLVNELLVDERLVRFINMTSDLMILNDISTEVLDFLEPNLPSKVNNAFERIKEGNFISTEKYIQVLVSEFNIVSFARGLNKSVKTSVLKSMFTCFRGLDYESLSYLDKIRKSYEENDEFNFFKNVHECASNVILHSLVTPIFNPISKALITLSPIAEDFVSNYGSSDIDRIYYYVGDKFSREEIEANAIKAYSSVNFNKQVERKDGESFVNYMIRLTNINKIKDESEVVKFKNKYLDKCSNYAVVLSSCNLPTLFLNTFGKPFNLTLTIIEVFYQLMLKDLGSILNALHIDAGLANKLSEVEECDVTAKSQKALYAKIALRNLFYLDTAFNITGDNTKLISEESLSGGGELDLDIDVERFIKLATEDLERFESATRHIPQEVKNVIYEHYSFGERES